MKSYFVIWTYIANYGTMTIEAASPHAAAERVYNGFSDDFRARGTIHVAEAVAVETFRNQRGDVNG